MTFRDLDSTKISSHVFLVQKSDNNKQFELALKYVENATVFTTV